jgi:hypothetical protein
VLVAAALERAAVSPLTVPGAMALEEKPMSVAEQRSQSPPVLANQEFVLL